MHAGRENDHRSRALASRTRIINLETHPEKYVTVTQLAEYWQVSRKQIYKQIDAGALEAIRLGERLYRIRAGAAFEFEQQANMRPVPAARRADKK
jgi:excisionase family DNA binding protein